MLKEYFAAHQDFFWILSKFILAERGTIYCGIFRKELTIYITTFTPQQLLSILFYGATRLLELALASAQVLTTDTTFFR